jgi:hypothetical protein
MNPYLERPDVWLDFHNRFVVRFADQLAGDAGVVTPFESNTTFICGVLRPRTRAA